MHVHECLLDDALRGLFSTCLFLLHLPSLLSTCLCSYVYYQTTLTPLPDSTWHIPISRYLADVSHFVTLPFLALFPMLALPLLDGVTSNDSCMRESILY